MMMGMEKNSRRLCRWDRSVDMHVVDVVEPSSSSLAMMSFHLSLMLLLLLWMTMMVVMNVFWWRFGTICWLLLLSFVAVVVVLVHLAVLGAS